MSTEESCFLCQETDPHLLERCNFCNLVYFCCADHFKVHRPADYCFPFRILHRPEVGRYVVAVRDIEANEIILRDSPAVYGPEHETPPVCMECLTRVDGSYLCPDCSLPLCDETCYEKRQYHGEECSRVFSKSPSGYQHRVNFNLYEKQEAGPAFSPEYCCIAPLRLLLNRDLRPELWSRLEMLMDHAEDRKKETKYTAMFQKNVVDFLVSKLRLPFTEEEVFRAIGILRTNAFFVEDEKLKRQGLGARAVYPTFSFLSHSCMCNARYSVLPSHEVVLRAQLPILKGEEITIQYISFMYGHLRRQKDIRDCWFFSCSCERCQDPRELNSGMSAVRCGAENYSCDGDVLPCKGSDFVDDDWECKKCGQLHTITSIRSMIKRCEDKLNAVEGNDVLGYEALLEELLQELRPSHYIVLTVKKYLGDLYGLTNGYLYRQLSRERFEKKIEYLTEFIKTIENVDPGLTRWRGLALHSLCRPMMYKANSLYHVGKITKEEFVSTVTKLIEDLKECVKCLEVEPEGSREAEVAALAKDDVKKLKELVMFADFI